MKGLCCILPLVLMFTCTALCQAGNDARNEKVRAKVNGIVQVARDILAGRNLEKAGSSVASGARLIDGRKFEYLRSVLTGGAAACPLADTSYQMVMVEAETSNGDDMGFLRIKTRQTPDTARVRFHSIVFRQDSTGEYKIVNWHTSE
ncbi:MAG TPA: hypothetical protein VMW43_05075 [Bacteroidota bacterium]|nr:hypothetical protein [Bacteroidota bacterium]